MATVRAEDVMSVGTRVSWGAIFAGCVLALALFFMLSLLGGAVGVSVGDRVEATSMRNAALIWAIVTLCASLFVGGLVTSQFTVGENKAEALLYGVLMWALLFAILLGLAAAGVRAGMSGTVGMANLAASASTESWETAARRAGVPAEQIDEWRRRAQATPGKGDTPTTPQISPETATRVTWYAFAGTWLSLFAAAGGAWLGAGPTFRMFAVAESTRGPLVG